MSGKGGYITGQIAHAAPTWDDVVSYSTEGQAAGYAMGWAHGWREGYEAAQRDAQDAARGAQIARAGVDAVDTVRAREKAAKVTGRGPSRRWVA